MISARAISGILVVAVLATMSAVSCASPPASTPPPAVPPTTVSASQLPWQQDWDKTLRSAKNEGKVVAFTSFGSEANNVVTRAFKDKYGLDMEFVVGGEPAFLTKLQSEHRAGLFLEDIFMGGLNNFLSFKEAGYLDPVKPLIILPEALDGKVWLGGEILFSDKDGLTVGYQIKVVPPLIVNTDLVKPGEIKSYRDLLHPKWKESIVVFDPGKGLHGPTIFQLFWEIMGPDFTRQLAPQLVIVGDARQQVEWVARGKYPMSGVMSSDTQAEFVKAGAPLKVVIPGEGTVTAAGKGGLAVLNRAPHPNAAKIFANWLLTREGQTIMTQVSGNPSRRLDVSTEWVSDPAFIVQPGVKYVNSDTESKIRERQELVKVYKDYWTVK